MCVSPMWRVAVPEGTANFIFKNDLKGYRNGAFIISQNNPGRLEVILNLLERFSPRVFKKVSSSIVTIPCGSCLECKIANSKAWAQRAVLESLCHNDNYFITLTYDDDHLPDPLFTFSRHDLTLGYWSPLLYRDFELFKKRLLERYRELGHVGIRFFACGEYGSKNGRPHFHAIFYNLPIHDLEFNYSSTLNGENIPYLTSKLITDTWGKGFITIGECNSKTAAYVARYVIKKFTSDDEVSYSRHCESLGFQPLPSEFRQASRRPGLGRTYFDLHFQDIYKSDKVYLPDGVISKPSSYFDILYKKINEEDLFKIKLSRRFFAELSNRNELLNVININSYLKNKHEKIARQISLLKRPL